ncbi:MAG: hypothetical protein KDB27_16545 [Planctomycetales bacterium]|nr:hypothetical protein [Planctomycetales bacterium]
MEYTISQSEFKNFHELIYRETGITLRESKRQLLQSRLRKRLVDLDLDSYQAYYDYLLESDPHGDELIRMINCVTTNKTSFFREYHHFEFLRDVVFKQKIEQAKNGGPRKLRIWSAACSMGEEPYSIAMNVHNAFADQSGWDIRILASDIDTEVLAHAQRGFYETSRLAGIPKEHLQRHFTKKPDGMEVRPHLKDLLTFRRINFADENWPIKTQFDVIMCRNAMIYFDHETQDKLLRRFSEYLPNDSHLILGHSESLVRAKDLYKPLGKTIFVRTGVQSSSPPQQAPPTLAKPVSKPTASAASKKTSASKAPAVHTKLRATPAPAKQKETVKVPKKPIIVGEVFASREPTCVTTLLGSCIAACLYDEDAQIGGMNHFLLPNGSGDRDAASYGIHAMELLINEIMGLGGDRRRLQAKVFGGGHVIENMKKGNSVGDKNSEFVKHFLEVESIPIVSEYLGGDSGLQVQFFTDSGRARVKKIEKRKLPREEVKPSTPKLEPAAAADDGITLF